MNQGQVSIIIPCYNHVQFIEQAINSVLCQTYRNIQLVVVDDGSTDGSVAILKELERKHNFLLCVQANMGVCKTLNRAIREFSSGEYIALLASDDYWHPEKLDKQMAALSRNRKSEFCFTQAAEFSGNEAGADARVFPRKVLAGRVTSQVFLRQHVPAGSMLFSRRLFDEVGGFDETLREEDWDFVIRCSAKTEFSSVQEPLFFYRSHVGNTMKTRARAEIFRQKALILSKNFHLVSPARWALAISIHFMHDILLARFLKK